MNDFDKAVLNFFADNEQSVLKEYRAYDGEYKSLCEMEMSIKVQSKFTPNF